MSFALKNIVRHSSVYAAGSLLSSATSFLLIPLYTRYLLPADYGILEILNVSVQVLVIVSCLGVTNGLDKSFLKDADSEEQRKVAATTAAVFVLVMSAAALSIFILFLDRVSALLFGDAKFSPWFAIIVLVGFVRLSYAVPMRLLRAELKSVIYVSIELLGFAVTIALNIYLVVFRDLKVLGILYGDLIGSLAVLLCSIFFVRKYLVLRFSLETLKQMLRFGLPLVPAMLAFWILRVSDRYFLQHYCSTHEVGLYAMGVRFALILELLCYAPFNNNWPAIYFRVIKQEDAKEEFSSIFTYFLLALCFFALAISALSRPAIQLMTTAAFYDAHQVVPLLILATLFLGIYTNVTIGVGITGKTEYHAVIVVMAALVNIALNFLLIPAHGMLGAALATAIAYGVKLLAGYIVGMKLYPIRYDVSRIIKIVAAFCPPFIVHSLFAPPSLLGEIMFDAGLLASYLLLLVAFRFFSPVELAWAKSQWRKGKERLGATVTALAKL